MKNYNKRIIITLFLSIIIIFLSFVIIGLTLLNTLDCNYENHKNYNKNGIRTYVFHSSLQKESPSKIKISTLEESNILDKESIMNITKFDYFKETMFIVEKNYGYIEDDVYIEKVKVNRKLKIYIKDYNDGGSAVEALSSNLYVVIIPNNKLKNVDTSEYKSIKYLLNR